jgi:hypothetical protein
LGKCYFLCLWEIESCANGNANYLNYSPLKGYEGRARAPCLGCVHQVGTRLCTRKVQADTATNVHPFLIYYGIGPNQAWLLIS